MKGYRIADRLGGEAARIDYVKKQRAVVCGWRLTWFGPRAWTVIGWSKTDCFNCPTHPTLDTPNGPDVSGDARVSIQLEDGYWNESDAAVVFKSVHRESGQTRYIYHGNDGTQMPWNDTAQLDYLKPQVREAVIQTILDVARRFPVIRSMLR